MRLSLTRRHVLQLAASAVAAASLGDTGFADTPAPAAGRQPLEEFLYSQVALRPSSQLAQRQDTHRVLMDLNEDSLLKPFREMVGQPAPGDSLGGWYEYKPDYDYKTDKNGLAPSATFGQWVSALARYYSATGDPATRQKALRLNALYAQTIRPAYYEKNRFPAYCFDKLVCGLMDAHRLAGDPDAFRILNATADAALPQLPGRAVDRDVPWRNKPDISWDWDESYTIPENLYLVYSMGAGQRYLAMANQYLDDKTYFDPLARGENVFGGKHAYSYVNALCSAMQAYMVGGSSKHLAAARNGFDMLEQQSYATAGWGPDEFLSAPGSGNLFASLTNSHNTFETPCGSYAHMKLTRYLLRVTRDGRYGDSMERVMYNTVLGAKPLHPNGNAFYYSDYNFTGSRVYSDHIWPCCSGTLPQVAADYGINAYLREPGAVWVNLYIPSILRWSEGSTQLALEQSGDYPQGDSVELRVTASTSANFALYLRVPAWAENARASVNRSPFPLQVQQGFALIRRSWKTGDVVSLELPRRPRLQPIDAAHPQIAALMDGPLVLFASTSAQPAVTRQQALAARHTALAQWVIDTATGPLCLLPFTQVGDAPYTTYLRLT